ncbi:transcriptional regulator [Novosphingobium clariflavum]|uniref:Transcriptional regulator n=1 Tax=Novosphingobium clariflavum TaxID=2029884 RepID=A0ABV6S1G1_9SPHN
MSLVNGMPIEHSSSTPLARAVRAIGSQSAFARLIGKRQSVVFGWLKSEKPLPLEYVPTVAEATGIPMAELRPDAAALFETDSPKPVPMSGGLPSAVQTPAAADGIHNPLRGLER